MSTNSPAIPLFKPPPDYQGPFIFLDLDNTLYPVSSGVSRHMSHAMRHFLKSHLNWTDDEAAAHTHRYYRDHGLSIKGLMKYHGVDPRVYDGMVDGSLPLESLLTPSSTLSALCTHLCTTYPTYILTNAALPHALRVLHILHLSQLFPNERIVACDYGEPEFPCKPFPAMWEKAMEVAGVPDGARGRCVLVDDAPRNCVGAVRFGWTAVHVTAIDSMHPASMEEPFIDEEDVDIGVLDAGEPVRGTNGEGFEPNGDAGDDGKGLYLHYPVRHTGDFLPLVSERGGRRRVPQRGERWHSQYGHLGVERLEEVVEAWPEVFGRGGVSVDTVNGVYGTRGGAV